MDSFASRLEQRRKEKKLSQDALAQLMGKSHRTVVSSWETGKAEPSLADVRKLAEVLETTAAWLIEGVGEGELPMMKEPPPGYVLVPAEELIDLQRRLLQQQDSQINRLK